MSFACNHDITRLKWLAKWDILHNNHCCLSNVKWLIKNLKSIRKKKNVLEKLSLSNITKEFEKIQTIGKCLICYWFVLKKVDSWICSWKHMRRAYILKFIYSEKATKFCKIFTLRNIWLALHRTKVRWRFCKILWPSQNIWTLQ